MSAPHTGARSPERQPRGWADHAPRLGYGVAALGNLYAALDEATWRACVPAAWDAGIRYFDVAPHYGLGLAEERLGESLAAYPREEFVLSTKVGRRLEERSDYAGESDLENLFDVPATRRRIVDYSRDGVLRSIEESLERLGLDRIDLVLVHDPDAHEREALEGAFPALDELRSEGVIGAYGAGMNQSAMLARFVRETDLDTVMVAGRYTLLDQSALVDLLPAARERDVAVIAAAVFNSGLLASDSPTTGSTFDYAPAPAGLVSRAQALARIAGEHSTSLRRVAVQFALRHPAVSTVVFGAASADQARENARLLAEPVPESFWAEAAERGLLDG
ncbi:aldo/keto reductase [Compostimonas suwonensis]|uniref:D-threo-aldose 1-dehydrogenase n=1 Tax=Compostimonas suwonensis TaxID=1048394 RepID=A0A2M9BVM3_9MICO|nr:aldo/keto reductase [Compostimonas suwonensis]PJJ61996.1 D-threo-aldose 1-dehydrogenase [Compostimonas suwonensis]